MKRILAFFLATTMIFTGSAALAFSSSITSIPNEDDELQEYVSGIVFGQNNFTSDSDSLKAVAKDIKPVGDVSSPESVANKTALDTMTPYIDMDSERLYVPEGVSIQAYSLDGGNKWRAGSLGSEDGQYITKMLNKGMNLVLCTAFDNAEKAPQKGSIEKGEEGAEDTVKEGAYLITFPTINKRPKPQKLVINYFPARDPSGATTGAWVLTEKNSNRPVKKGIQIAESGSGKLPIETEIEENGKNTVYTWGEFPMDEGSVATGINVELCASKAVRRNFVYRYAPSVQGSSYTPATKAVRLKASSTLKATTFKIDYKKEILKGKEGMNIFFGDSPEYLPAAEVKSNSAKSPNFTDKYITDVSKQNARAGIDISGFLSEESLNMVIWTGATAKKPASKPQLYTTAPRAFIIDEVIEGKNGSISLAKTYEVYNGTKWGSMPKVTSSTTLKVRVKNTAKSNGKSPDSGTAASRETGLKVAYGFYDDAKTKSGALSAEIERVEYSGVLRYKAQETEHKYGAGIESLSIDFDVWGMVDLDGENLLMSSATSLAGTAKPEDSKLTDEDKAYFYVELKPDNEAKKGLKIKEVVYDPDKKCITVEIESDSANPTDYGVYTLSVKFAYKTGSRYDELSSYHGGYDAQITLSSEAREAALAFIKTLNMTSKPSTDANWSARLDLATKVDEPLPATAEVYMWGTSELKTGASLPMPASDSDISATVEEAGTPVGIIAKENSNGTIEKWPSDNSNNSNNSYLFKYTFQSNDQGGDESVFEFYVRYTPAQEAPTAAQDQALRLLRELMGSSTLTAEHVVAAKEWPTVNTWKDLPGCITGDYNEDSTQNTQGIKSGTPKILNQLMQNCSPQIVTTGPSEGSTINPTNIPGLMIASTTGEFRYSKPSNPVDLVNKIVVVKYTISNTVVLHIAYTLKK